MNTQLLSRVELITPALAEEYLRHNTCNRQLRKNIVDYYASIMEKGQWMLNGEGIIFNELGVLVDGQHRLAAVAKSGVNVEMLVVRNVNKDSFATIDSGITRKVSDTFFVKGIPNANNVSSIISKYAKIKAGRSFTTMDRLKNGNSISRQDLLKIYADDEDFWQETRNFASKCYREMGLMNLSEIGGLIAFLIKERKHPKEKVYEFFSDLFITDNPKMPMLAAYRKRMIKDKTSTVHMGATYRQQLFVKIWNYYVDGKETTFMRWNEEQEGKKTLK